MLRVDGDTVHYRGLCLHGGQKPALEYQERIQQLSTDQLVFRVDGDTVHCRGICLHGDQKPALEYQEYSNYQQISWVSGLMEIEIKFIAEASVSMEARNRP